MITDDIALIKIKGRASVDSNSHAEFVICCEESGARVDCRSLTIIANRAIVDRVAGDSP